MNIKVTIKTHHLKGNSYAHGADDGQRTCPLDEALIEAGYKPRYTGAGFVFIDNDSYKIDIDTWNSGTATTHIGRANSGSKQEIEVTLKKIG